MTVTCRQHPIQASTTVQDATTQSGDQGVVTGRGADDRQQCLPVYSELLHNWCRIHPGTGDQSHRRRRCPPPPNMYLQPAHPAINTARSPDHAQTTTVLTQVGYDSLPPVQVKKDC